MGIIIYVTIGMLLVALGCDKDELFSRINRSETVFEILGMVLTLATWPIAVIYGVFSAFKRL